MRRPGPEAAAPASVVSRPSGTSSQLNAATTAPLASSQVDARIRRSHASIQPCISRSPASSQCHRRREARLRTRGGRGVNTIMLVLSKSGGVWVCMRRSPSSSPLLPLAASHQKQGGGKLRLRTMAGSTASMRVGQTELRRHPAGRK